MEKLKVLVNGNVQGNPMTCNQMQREYVILVTTY